MSIKNGSQYMVLKKCGMAERVVHGCKKKGVDVITYKIDGNYTILGRFWTDPSLESPGCFFMRHTILWDNLDRSRDHPHRMGFGNLRNLCGCLEAAR